ncbi:MAG: hypothetical protein N2450_07840 [bacterium]|nr:hypothetical protein [bacterium]
MPSSFQFDNENIGIGPLLTCHVSTATNQSFVQTDLDANYTACAIVGDNVIGKGAAGDRLFGKVVWLSPEKVAGTIVPMICSVQARGVARFKYANPAPNVGDMVELAGNGKVRQASTSETVPAGGARHRGVVIAKDTVASTVDVWLG